MGWTLSEICRVSGIASICETSNKRKKKRPEGAADFFLKPGGQSRRPEPPRLSTPSGDQNQVQVIRPEAEDEQVLEVSECAAVAVQLAGGPVTAVAVTVTFCEGRKP